MNFKNIDWNHVTTFSQLVAIALFVGVFALGFWLGQDYQVHLYRNALTAALASPDTRKPIAGATYICTGDKVIRATYYQNEVDLILSDARHLTLPHALSADGARYANADESFVFWNKGNTAFITEGVGIAAKTTFADCVQKPQPQ